MPASFAGAIWIVLRVFGFEVVDDLVSAAEMAGGGVMDDSLINLAKKVWHEP